jgi:hypothetical protein
MTDETQTEQTNDPSEADNQAAGDKAAEVDTENTTDEVANDNQATDEVQPETDATEETEDTGVKNETEVAQEAPATTALDYGRHMEVNVNGQQYSGHPLVVPTNLVETVKNILFHAHGVTPNE